MMETMNATTHDITPFFWSRTIIGIGLGALGGFWFWTLIGI